jgi:hypothetical protein
LLKGKIVLIPFLFTNLTTTKLRPALVLLEGKKCSSAHASKSSSGKR